MARGKKKEKALTPEEKLAQALVPESEHPYQIPENWCWVKLSNVVDVLNGFAFKSQFYTEAGIRIIRIANVQDGYVEDEAPAFYPLSSKEEIEKYLLNAEDLLLSLTGNVGRVAILPAIFLPAALNQRVACLRNRDILNKYFLFFFLLRREFQVKCIKNSKGSAQLNMSTEWLKEQPVCLPPFAEQQRIVDRIEGLFAKLDEAKEKAQSVLDSFETRKAAILHKAFTGELTAKWRVDHNFSSAWTTKKLSEVAKLQTGLMKGKKFEGNTVFMPYLRVANVQDGYLSLDEIKEIEVAETGFERYLLQHGDVLFTEGGDFDKLGRGTVWRSEIENCLHQNHIFVVRVDKDILMPEFLSYQAGSRYGKNYFLSCAKQTTNLASLNSTQLKNFPVMIPPLAEQIEIVCIVDSLVTKEQQAKEAAEAVLEKIDLLKKSILARAFRGELGTNDPTDEPAIELLKRIL